MVISQNLSGSFVESAFTLDEVGDGVESSESMSVFSDLPQAEFLRGAMVRLGMTRNEFADRIGIKRKTLDNWLLPPGSASARALPKMGWKFISEILEKS